MSNINQAVRSTCGTAKNVNQETVVKQTFLTIIVVDEEINCL